MKKLIVMTALALFGAKFANAQFKAGDVLVGGTLGANSKSTKVDGTSNKTTVTGFTISPRVGVALNSQWMIGIVANTELSNTKVKTANAEAKVKSTLFAPGVFVRNYHTIGSSNFAFFGEATASYRYSKEPNSLGKDVKGNGFGIEVAPGIAYFITKRFALEGKFGGLGYTYDTFKTDGSDVKTKVGEFDFAFTKSFQVGVNFIF
ncbi:porin family protein [Chitinophaga pendula]|uniref:outer membrane beta-barrel protein n=1 Tax=Chitinophaga TaxID=79328 RepID=UPI000BAFBE93|nr:MULTISPECIES: outer membrane beta-barrel protein [Chitinophaga]ASZ10606.1 hypothetical protein CK934_06250 [Chitinophaga sp. MD30]UCJ06419.1 porin family protein [Chitinophaga pendula]